jgi:hypothetical protein
VEIPVVAQRVEPVALASAPAITTSKNADHAPLEPADRRLLSHGIE